MVNLKFKRDKRGRYVFDLDTINAFYKVKANDGEVFAHGSDEPIGCTLADESGRYYVKSRADEFSASAAGELLFSKFCQKNGVECADVDVGVFNGKSLIISKDVATRNKTDFNINLYDLYDGFVEKCVFGDLEYTVSAFMEYLKRAARHFGVKLSPDSRDLLVKKVLLDYIGGQEDFNAGGIMLNISPEKNLLRILPFYDNEYAFCFDVGYSALSGEQRRNILKNKFGEDINSSIKKTTESLTDDSNYPRLGIKTDTDIFPLVDFGPEYVLMHRDCDFTRELAQEVIKNESLYEFYKNLDTNITKMAAEIEAESGYKIERFFIKYANFVVKTRKSVLDKVINEELAAMSEAEK